ncbi:MAG: M1 family metallopeptidase [Candidatus Neomarinimicrobiota bacterium]
MNPFFKICILSAGLSFAGDSYHATPDRTFDMHHSRIELSINVQDESLKGLVTHTLTPFNTDFSVISLDCNDTEVLKVYLADNKALDFEQYSGKLWITLDRTYGLKDTISVSIEYNSNPKLGLYFVHADSVYPDKHEQAWTQGEQMDNHHWVPLHDYPNDKATFETILTVDKPFTAVSNGELVNILDNGETRTFHWRENHAMVSYLISFAVGEYKKVEDKSGDLPVNYWVYPEHTRADALRSFGKTPQMIKVFNESLAFDYPYEKYDQVLVEDFMWGGMENITLSHQTDRTMHPETARPNFTSDGLVAHELAHQWFGDLLTTRNWANIWLNEGLTSFMELIWVEAEKGRDEMEYYRYGDLKSMLRAANYDPRPMVYFEYDNPNNLFNANVYAKGAIIMNLLRDYLGYESFNRGLRKFTIDNAYKNVETNDLKKAFEESTGQNLFWYFNQWAYKKGLPELKVTTRYDRSNNRLIMVIKQTQDIEESSLFKLPMTVLIDDGKISRHSIVFDKLKDEFSFSCSRPPRLVVLDEGLKTPKILDFKKSDKDLIYQLENAPHVLDRVWAAVELGKGSPGRKVTDALINSMENDPFWGVRKEAVKAFGKLKPRGGATKILALAFEEDARVWRERIKALGLFGENSEVSAYLVNILETENKDYILVESLSALIKTDPQTAPEWITWALSKDSHGDILRRRAIKFLGDDKTDENLKELISRADYGGTTWRARSYAAYYLLGFVEDYPETLDWFKNNLNDPNRYIRGICIDAIGTNGNKKDIALLLDLDNPFHQNKIDKALKKLQNPKKSNRYSKRK